MCRSSRCACTRVACSIFRAVAHMPNSSVCYDPHSVNSSHCRVDARCSRTKTMNTCSAPCPYKSKSICATQRTTSPAHARPLHDRRSQPRALPQRCRVGGTCSCLRLLHLNVAPAAATSCDSELQVSCCVAQAVLRSVERNTANACCSECRLTLLLACATSWMCGASRFATRKPSLPVSFRSGLKAHTSDTCCSCSYSDLLLSKYAVEAQMRPESSTRPALHPL